MENFRISAMKESGCRKHRNMLRKLSKMGRNVRLPEKGFFF